MTPARPSHHLPLAELEARFNSLPAPPKDSGRVALLVSRRDDGVRDTPARIRLTPEHGMPGDKWGRRLPLNPDAQLTVMRRAIAELLANGQPLTVFGDNLFVDFDISAANLPTGTRLRVGDALIEVSPKAHNGCSKFQARFGDDALRFVQAKLTRDQNFRGIYWKVVEPGDVSVGATIEVLSRG